MAGFSVSAMPYDNPLKLKLSKDLREKCERYILENVANTVAVHKKRDEDLFRWRDSLHGVPTGYTTGVWKNSCQIEDGLMQEQRVQLVPSIVKPTSQSTLVLVNETTLSDATRAQHLEVWGNAQLQKRGFIEQFEYYADSCASYVAGVLATTWKETERKKRGLRYWDGESYDAEGEPLLVGAGERFDDVEYEAVPVLEPMETERGVDFAAVPLWDFYACPPDVASIDKASSVMERRFYTDNDFLNGIEDFDFEEDKVYDCLRFFSEATSNEERERVRNLWGIEDNLSDFKQGECFIWYGYLPKCYGTDGRPELPKHLWNDRFCAVVYPAANCVLKLDFSPYDDEYPYDTGNLFGEVGTWYGLGICPMTEQDQQEATHWRRTASNTADMIAAPATIMADGAWELNKGQSLYPGAIFREETQGSIRPYEMPTAPTMISTQMLDYTRNRAQAKMAAQGFGQVNPKQPLVAEMEGVMAATDTKFDFYQHNVFKVVPKVYQKMLRWYQKFDPGFSATFLHEGAEVTISGEEISGQYDFSVAPLNSGQSEEARIQKDAAILKIQDEYIRFLMETIGTPLAGMQEAKWTACRDAMAHLGVRKPETYLKQKPPPEGLQPPAPAADPMAMVQELMAMGGGANGQSQPGMGAPRNGAGMGGGNPAFAGSAAR